MSNSRPEFPIVTACIVCKKVSKRSCSICKQACYCSQECQEKDKKSHSVTCNPDASKNKSLQLSTSAPMTWYQYCYPDHWATAVKKALAEPENIYLCNKDGAKLVSLEGMQSVLEGTTSWPFLQSMHKLDQNNKLYLSLATESNSLQYD